MRTAPSLVKLLICRPDPRILSPTSESMLREAFNSKKSLGTVNRSPNQIPPPNHSRSPVLQQKHLANQSQHTSNDDRTAASFTASTRAEIAANRKQTAFTSYSSSSSSLSTGSSSPSVSSGDDDELVGERLQVSAAVDNRSSISATSTTTYSTQVCSHSTSTKE